MSCRKKTVTNYEVSSNIVRAWKQSHRSVTMTTPSKLMTSQESLPSQQLVTSSVLVLEFHLEQIFDVDLCHVVNNVSNGNC